MTQTARTYGESLYELARDEQLDEEILPQLKMVVKLLEENPEYVTFLSLPSVPKQERCKALDESFQGRIHPYLLSFLKILTANRTVSQLPGCEEAFRRRFYADHGILEVTAVSAVLLTEETLQKLQSRIAEQTGKTVVLQSRVAPEILGGIRLEMEGKRLDGTIRTRLEDMQSILRDMVL